MSSSSSPNLKHSFQSGACQDSGCGVNFKPKKRPSPLSVRLSAEQRAQLEHDAIGMSLNAYVLSKLFDDPEAARKRRRKSRAPSTRDKAVSRALRRLSHAGIAAYLAGQILAQEEGRLFLSANEEEQLREAYAECYQIRCDLVEAMGLRAESDFDCAFAQEEPCE